MENNKTHLEEQLSKLHKVTCTFCGYTNFIQMSHIEHSLLNKCTFIESEYDVSKDSSGNVIVVSKSQSPGIIKMRKPIRKFLTPR